MPSLPGYSRAVTLTPYSVRLEEYVGIRPNCPAGRRLDRFILDVPDQIPMLQPVAVAK